MWMATPGLEQAGVLDRETCLLEIFLTPFVTWELANRWRAPIQNWCWCTWWPRFKSKRWDLDPSPTARWYWDTQTKSLAKMRESFSGRTFMEYQKTRLNPNCSVVQLRTRGIEIASAGLFPDIHVDTGRRPCPHRDYVRSHPLVSQQVPSRPL